MLANKNVNLVIVGKIGPNMATALSQKEIQVRVGTGVVKDVLSKV